jgi:Zn-dependent protease/predicted transcriptional regulator
MKTSTRAMPTRPGFLIGRILGIPIYLHASWVIVFGLISLSLVSQFQSEYSKWSSLQHWTVGLVTSILFFASVIFHELCHSIVARRYKIQVISITLFIFGGLARIGRDPNKAIQEFNIAAAGPVSSYFLAAVFLGIAKVFAGQSMIEASAGYLSVINFWLATFNLLPGFPLDGGRIFRALAWAWTKDFSRATRIAGASGRFIAYGMILIGIWLAAVQHQWQSGLWTAFIGWFLLNAAQESVAQLAVREMLSGLRASDVMSHEIPNVPGSISLAEYGAEVLRTGRRFHLVTTDDRLVGMMNTHALNSVPQDEWASTSVQAAMIPHDKILWAAPEEPLLRLLERLSSLDINQMPVVTDGTSGTHVVGMISRDSILRVLQARAELGHSAAGPFR